MANRLRYDRPVLKTIDNQKKEGEQHIDRFEPWEAEVVRPKSKAKTQRERNLKMVAESNGKIRMTRRGKLRSNLDSKKPVRRFSY